MIYQEVNYKEIRTYLKKLKEDFQMALKNNDRVLLEEVCDHSGSAARLAFIGNHYGLCTDFKNLNTNSWNELNAN